MRAGAGTGHFQGDGCLDCPRGLDVGECIEHRGRAVEVGRQPVTSVVVEHRVQADLRAGARQLLGDHWRAEAQVFALFRLQSATPASPDCRHPPAFAQAGVVPPNRVRVGACGEQRGVEGDLVGRRRTGMHATRRGLEDRSLSGARWSRVCWRELQQPQEPCVLSSQPLHLGSQAGEVKIDRASCWVVVRHCATPYLSISSAAGSRKAMGDGAYNCSVDEDG